MADFAAASKIAKLTKAGLASVGMALLLTCIACNGTQPAEGPATDPAPETAPEAAPEAESVADAVAVPTESWRCRNDMEVNCAEGKCDVSPPDGFTPMDVNFDDTGAISVCAYSGCWEGHGSAIGSDNFLVLVGHDLKYSTASDPDSAGEDIVIALDRTDKVATLKAATFAQPLLCERSEDVSDTSGG